ncbi:RNA polymerase sigma factor [Sinanaerobacter chloroacetimidivorans]|uniref:Sigma-70 family RNA polymerase sigma factor n=1 Tax=Sinanaerobacter chloroacetimidivorans TaxID=2818044 RepID=A0A8J7W5E8_9FIRM|nr:sigma-70 family RNA polymerase sigma factor [Sinanaerobacter chloroacetimidivorans]MBR0599433.1 sigma-70 family RNA polymerase sigma factor [Sinanaerobacter chloroacetimidivorans]
MKQFSVPDHDNLPDMQRLISDYGNHLLRMCYLYLHDLQLAEDAVQETYIKVYQNWSKFKRACSEKTWITSIAMNVCKSYLRGSWYRNLMLSSDLEQEPFYDGKIKDDTVLHEIGKLKPKYREVILLFYYQEMRIKDIASALKITESAVTVRLSRARKQLEKTLKGWYFNV